MEMAREEQYFRKLVSGMCVHACVHTCMHACMSMCVVMGKNCIQSSVKVQYEIKLMMARSAVGCKKDFPNDFLLI